MKVASDNLTVELLPVIGSVLGITLLLACFFVADLRFLGIPALALLVPGLIYGMR